MIEGIVAQIRPKWPCTDLRTSTTPGTGQGGKNGSQLIHIFMLVINGTTW